jgi:hypothetical protein
MYVNAPANRYVENSKHSKPCNGVLLDWIRIKYSHPSAFGGYAWTTSGPTNGAPGTHHVAYCSNRMFNVDGGARLWLESLVSSG